MTTGARHDGATAGESIDVDGVGGARGDRRRDVDLGAVMREPYSVEREMEMRMDPADKDDQMKVPSLADRVVKVRAYLTDRLFGYEHWEAKQFSTPDEAKPALLLIFDTASERDTSAASFAANSRTVRGDQRLAMGDQNND